MKASALGAMIAVVTFAVFSAAIVGCKKPSESKPCSITQLPAGKWELHVKDATGQAIAATAVPVVEGSREDQDSSFDEFRRQPAAIRSDEHGVIRLTRSETSNAPAPLTRDAWCVRVSAPGYLDKDIGVVTIYESELSVIPVVLQRRRTTGQE